MNAETLQTEGFDDMDDAIARLNELEAAETAGGGAGAVSTGEDLSSLKQPPEEQATGNDGSAGTEAAAVKAATSEGAKAPPDAADAAKETKTGTPAADDKAKKVEEGKGEEKQGEEKGSKFSKEKVRQDRSWKALNAEKDKLEADRKKFQEEQSAFEQKRTKTSEDQPKYKSSDYDNYARKMEAKAKELEDGGKFDEADKCKGTAKLAQEKADQLRETEAKRGGYSEEEFETRINDAWHRATEKYPALTQKDSPLNAAVMKLVQEMPTILDHPEGPFIGAQLAQAQLDVATHKAAAARVPDLEKQVKELTSHVSRLQELTKLPGGGAPARQPGEKTWDKMSDAEQEQQLRQEVEGLPMNRV